jgi:hypothetical protein
MNSAPKPRPTMATFTLSDMFAPYFSCQPSVVSGQLTAER